MSVKQHNQGKPQIRIDQIFDPSLGQGRSGSSSRVPDPVAVPGLMSRAQELLSHIGSLEKEQAQVRGALFGWGLPDNDSSRPEFSTVEAILTDACQRLATLVGDMASINAKVAN